jgi:YidC/Oxa1 family membrane protein insertase
MQGDGRVIDAVLTSLEQTLRFFHTLAEPVFGAAAWGWAIILLTVAVRIVLLPLAIKQTTSMRAMQRLQPELTKIRDKYKVDRSLMRTDPEKYRAKRQQQQEAMMALYKEHNVNPAAGCLPLVLQMPVFFALFSVLNSASRVPELSENGFYVVASLAAGAASAGLGGYVLIALMAATTFYSQKQMMASNPSAAQQPQQRVMLYVMPVMLTFFAISIPVGVLLYWVTTNVWTMAQQYVMFRSVDHSATPAAPPPKRKADRASKGKGERAATRQGRR